MPENIVVEKRGELEGERETPEKMVVKKGLELKNKMIVGGVVPQPSNLLSPSYLWEIAYYVLDLNTGEVLSLPCAVFGKGFMPSNAVLGSKLYTFGKKKANDNDGQSTTTNTNTNTKSKSKKKKQQNGLFSCQLLDLSKPDSGWSVVATGFHDQSWPKGVIQFRGKIYVFGNILSGGFRCEVFDPQDNKWRRIESPPFPPPTDEDVNSFPDYRRLTLPVLLDYRKNRIIVFFQRMARLCAYYPCEDRWQCVAEDFIGSCLWSQPLTLADDGVIYIYNPSLSNAFFMAYDTATNERVDVRFSREAEAEGKDPKSYVPYSKYTDLVHRGNGLLCLITSFGNVDQHQAPGSVHIAQFKVKLVKSDHNSKEVLVTPFSSKHYNLDSLCIPNNYHPF